MKTIMSIYKLLTTSDEYIAHDSFIAIKKIYVMKKTVITALSVAFLTTAFAQENTVKVKNETSSKTEVKAEKGHTTLSETSKIDARAESNRNRAELKDQNAVEAGLNHSIQKGESASEKSHTTISETLKMDSRAESGQNRAELKGENATEAILSGTKLEGRNVTEVENTIEVDNKNKGLTSKVDKAIDKVASEELNTSNDHGEAVSAVAKSSDIIGIRGQVFSEVANSKAVSVSPKVDEIKVGVGSNTKTDVGVLIVTPKVSPSVKTTTKVKANVNVKPIKVAPKVRVKNNLGVKL